VKNAAMVYRNLFKPLSNLLVEEILNSDLSAVERTRWILERVLSPMYTQSDIDAERSSMLMVIKR